MHIQTFRHPKLSTFQSAVDNVFAERKQLFGAALPVQGAAPASEATGHFATTVENAIVSSNTELEPAAVSEGLNFAPPPSATPPDVSTVTPGEVVVTLAQCAKLAFQRGEALLIGDTAKANLIEAELADNVCDPRWLEASEQYVAYFTLGGGKIPYKTYRDLSDYVIDNVLPENATIGFIADWGTGTPTAVSVLQQVASFNPDILIHLGDIYYSGTEPEDNAFLAECRAAIGGKQIYTLSGNHDMYSGGVPYYALLKTIGQPASYFCLRNANWQLLAMDTGYHDCDPNIIQSIMTYLVPEEVTWHLDKINNAAGRKTVLLSHHQYFTACQDIAGGSINTKLQDSFSTVIDRVALWLWGHEHNMVKYGPFGNLNMGRCIGCGAIPVFTVDDPYTPKFTDVPMLSPRLGNNGEIYNHGFAIMKLAGPTGTVDYYDCGDITHPMWADEL